ncbi:MAG: MFS transporter [Bryobacteraceae bacterium]|nr:MFS transporter [Bryobacteraceae bacterium]
MPIRWVVLGVFVLSSALNYLDRQILAQLAPVLKAEFHLSNQDFGFVLSAFSILYAACAPFAGLFVDRAGLNRAASIAVATWSLAGVGTGLVSGFAGLLGARALLGLAESAGVPASGKAVRLYLKPEERALGGAVSQLGLSVGSFLAPPIATFLALWYGWRSAFILTGLLGFLWIPLWLAVAKRFPPRAEAQSGTTRGAAGILRDSRLWAFATANILGMAVYTLWSNWVTIFLMQTYSLKLVETPWLAGIPPLVAPLGGFFGGWISLRLVRRGMEAPKSRRMACLASAIALLGTAAVPWMPSAGLATAAVAISFFWASSYSVNLYALPLDVYGAEHAAFSTSILTCAYGVLQALFSPVIGGMVDRYGFEPVCLLVAILPLVGTGVLKLAEKRQ